MNIEKVFITGGDGLLGSHIVRELLKQNYHVKAIIETGKSPSTILGLENVSICFGNILDSEILDKEIEGCDYIIHVAASTMVVPAKNEIVWKVNVTGTEYIINAALKHKVKRLVHIGSANTFGYGSLENLGNEKSPYNSGKFGLDYIESKYKAHQLILDSVKNRSLPAIIVCPTFMLGKYDSKPGSGALVVSIYNEEIPGYSPGGKNYVHVNDVAVAICNALKMGEIGESYILGGVNLSYKDAFNLIAKTIGVKAPKIAFPKSITVAYGALSTSLSSLFGKTPKVNAPLARIANEECYYDNSKAIKELQMPQTSLEVAIKDCFEWLKENNLLRKN